MRSGKAPITRCGRPLAHSNPDSKCWLNALMAMLTVYHPFQDTLASTENAGPLTDMLREHFKNLQLCLATGTAKVVDTSNVVHNLRVALEHHRQSYPTSACQA
jgi:hypothetical protein